MALDLALTIGLGLYVLCSALLLVYGLNAYVMLGLFWRSRRRCRREARRVYDWFAAAVPDSELPVVTTQLPIFNERNVIERLLKAVCAFDYPREKHEIQVLDDSTDSTTETVAGLVVKLRAAGHDVRHIRRADRSGFKAGALAEGLRRARGEFVAVFDADFVPPPDFLRQTVPFLLADERCGFVQTRWGHRNRGFSLLTLLQSIGIDGHFVVEQTARAGNGLFCNFNGTAGVWRAAAIADAGGWRADTLTEDLDLSYRCMLRGWRPCFLLDVVTPAEVPTDINALKSQQRRWAKGSIQTAVQLLPTVLRRPDFGWFQKTQAVLHLTHYMIHPLILLMTILVLPLIALLQIRFTTPFAVPLVVIMLLALLGPSSLYLASQILTGRGWRSSLLALPALVALGIGLAVNNSRAVLEALLDRAGGEFVRTPKLGAAAEAPVDATGAPRPAQVVVYRQPLSRLYLVEFLMGLWAFAAFLGYLLTIGSLAGLLLLVQAVGFICVGILSLRHHRYAARPG
jgi:cellulose synthase/poly-beta-1,6-N-acetylglucosamine synthase-like glycosyltransferase